MYKPVGILGSLVACYLLSLFFGDILKSVPQQLGLSVEPAYIGYGIGGILLIAVAIMTKFSIGSFVLFVLFVTHAMVGAWS